MQRTDFTNSDLVLIGHGSTVNDNSAAAVIENAAELRKRGLFAQVHAVFWKQEPKLTDLLEKLSSRRIFFVPMFISEGYFSENIIPQTLKFRTAEATTWPRVRTVNGVPWVYCKPVGTDPLMTELILDRARTIVSQFPFPRGPKPGEISLFIVGHGTEKDPGSRKAIAEQCDLIRQSGIYAQVEPVFLEEDPRVNAVFELAVTRNVVVVPFFISDGMHVQEDIPKLLGEPERNVKQRLGSRQWPWRNPTERKGKLVWYTQSVGSDPKMAEVILARVNEGLSFVKG